MDRIQAIQYIVVGLALAAYEFTIDGPTVPSFWRWIALSGLFVIGGTICLLLSKRQGTEPLAPEGE